MPLFTELEESVYRGFSEALLNRDRLALMPHMDPDPDALGSTLALGNLLRELGKDVRMLVVKPIPDQCKGMPESNQLEKASYIEDLQGYAPVAIDTGNIDRLPDSFHDLVERRGDLPLFNLDHHVSNDHYGDHNLVDPGAAAAAEIVFNLAQLWEVELKKTVAEQLYGAILTDTGKFTYANTSPRTLQIAARLIDTGLEVEAITDYLYNYRSLRQLRLFGRIFETCRGYPELDLMVCHSSLEMLEETGCEYGENEGATSLLKTVGDYGLSILLKQRKPDHVKVSMRSKDSSVSADQIMGALGGGGHPGAAGCDIEGNLKQAEQRVVQAVRDYLKSESREGEEQGVKQ